MVRAYQVSGRWRQSLLPGLSWSKVCHLIPTAIAGVIRSVLCIFTKPFGPENWMMRAFPLGQESHEGELRHSGIGRTRHDGSIDFSFAAPAGVAIRLGGGIACTVGIPLLCTLKGR